MSKIIKCISVLRFFNNAITTSEFIRYRERLEEKILNGKYIRILRDECHDLPNIYQYWLGETEETTKVSEQLINRPLLNLSSSMIKYMLTLWLFSNRATFRTAKTWLSYDSFNVMVTVFWDMTPYSQVNHYQCSGRTCYFHLQGKRTELQSSHFMYYFQLS
jgi:hypothetical protein